MASDTDRPITVVHDGTFSVSYTNTKGESSAFRCTPDVGALFAAAPDLLAACEYADIWFDQNMAQETGASFQRLRHKITAAIAKAKPHASRTTNDDSRKEGTDASSVTTAQ